MRTAISIDDALMEQADAAARELGMSRSGLVAEALRGDLDEWRKRSLTAQLDAVYAEQPANRETRLVRRLKRKLPRIDRW
jgi:metal-responsive CopG/Arc/MetJ family transcriptional regulator